MSKAEQISINPGEVFHSDRPQQYFDYHRKHRSRPNNDYPDEKFEAMAVETLGEVPFSDLSNREYQNKEHNRKYYDDQSPRKSKPWPDEYKDHKGGEKISQHL